VENKAFQKTQHFASCGTLPAIFAHEMKKTILIISFLLVTFIAFSQQKRNYKIFQFAENDSLNGHICKIVKFNERGLKSYEESIDYKFSKLVGRTDYIDKYYYKDTLITRIETNRGEIYKSVTKLSYNNKNQLVKTKISDFETRLKKNIKKGIEFGDCIIEDDDFEKNPSWKTYKIEFIKYDSKGRKIETYIPENFDISQNRYLYSYNYDGLLEKITSLENNEIIWEEFRENFENGNYDYIRLWKNEYNFKELCRSVGKVRFFYNDKNLLIESTKPDETGIRGDVKVKYYYNEKNELIKEERYSTENILEITHLYLYE